MPGPPATAGDGLRVIGRAEGAIEQWTSRPGRSEVLFTLGSWTQSPRVYRYDAGAAVVTDTGWLAPSPADFSGIETSSLFAPEMLAWYERGGVYTIAGLRGGGGYGREWHEASRGRPTPSPTSSTASNT
jgi:prolyl oligopeptidase